MKKVKDTWKNLSKKQKILTVIVGIIAFFFIVGLFSPKNGDISKTTTSTIVKVDTVNAKPVENWEYSDDVDNMSSVKNYYADCNSLNKIDFKFPYDGGSNFTLQVRNKDKKNEVLLFVSKGQFMTSIGNSEYVRIKFDNEQPLSFYYSSAADGRSNVIFINSSSQIISKLKKAKKIIIDAPFYESGRPQISFNVSGLNWSH